MDFFKQSDVEKSSARVKHKFSLLKVGNTVQRELVECMFNTDCFFNEEYSTNWNETGSFTPKICSTFDSHAESSLLYFVTFLDFTFVNDFV